MSGGSSDKGTVDGSRKPRRRAWWLLVLAAVVIGLFAANARIGEWLVRQSLEQLAPRWGWRVEAGTVSASLLKPIVLSGVRAGTLAGGEPKQTLEADQVVLAINSPLEILFGDGRVIRRADCVGADWKVDFRGGGAESRTDDAVDGPEEREWRAAMRLRFLPETIAVRSGGVTVDSDQGTVVFREISGAVSEETTSELSVGAVEVAFVGRSYRWSGLRAVTSWRDGVAYLSDLVMSDAVTVRTLVVSVADPGGSSVSVDLGVGAGDVRGDVSWRVAAGSLEVELALSAVELSLESVAEISGLAEPFGGILREGRVTWRGTPGRWADSEIALRLEVEGLTRRGETWDSLVAGANFIGRRLYFSNFQLAAAENRVTANGEIAVPRGEAGWLDSNFLLNVSANVREVRKLAVFAGDWWRDLEGRLSLHGSVSGDQGRVDGYANGEASGLTLRGLPPASMKFSTVLNDRELAVRSAELWSGEDRVTAKGVVDLEAPHRYSGEIGGTMADVSKFTWRLGGAVSKWLDRGGFTILWQGDGTWAAHSGVFRATLDDAATPWTPAGITGEFDGSYSPENLYLSKLRLRNGSLEFNTRLTVSDAGINLVGIDLRRQKLELLAGEAFVPVNLFALARGERPVDAIDLKKPVYARIGSGKLPLAELVAMAGQDAVAGGTVKFRLEASGPLPELALNGSVSGREVSAAADGYQFPKTAVDLAISTEKSRLLVDGSIDSKGFEPLVVEATMPFGFEIAEDGWARFFDRSAPVAAKISIPRTNLPIVGALIPGIDATAGAISGVLEIAGTVASPEFRGNLELAGGSLSLSDLAVPGVTDLDARIRLVGPSIEIAEAAGKLGGGDAELSGRWDAAQSDPLELTLKADDVAVVGFGFNGRADLRLRAIGDLRRSAVDGSVKVKKGAIDRQFVAARTGQKSAPSEKTKARESSSKKDGWTIDAKIDLEPTVKIGRGKDAGSLSGQLRMSGLLEAPRLAGRLSFRDLTVRTQAGWALPASGILDVDGDRATQWTVGGSGESVIAGEAVAYRFVGGSRSLLAWGIGPGDLAAIFAKPVQFKWIDPVSSGLRGQPVEWKLNERKSQIPIRIQVESTPGS